MHHADYPSDDMCRLKLETAALYCVTTLMTTVTCHYDGYVILIFSIIVVGLLCVKTVYVTYFICYLEVRAQG